MERPALKQLLLDIDPKKVNVVVVYKVDCLTRSLADFAKIVEHFDAKGISFVSVTQQFNTTNSMGRLTLNVLLSFAQFGREVTGERIRDKVAASKQKGIWMGGTPSLGYYCHERRLLIDDASALLIQTIFEQYLSTTGIKRLKANLDAASIKTPKRVNSSEKAYGDKPFSRGNLHEVLTNPIYIEKVRHHDKVYEGQHEAIIPIELWNAVQEKIRNNLNAHRSKANVPSDSLLVGIMFDEQGERRIPAQTLENHVIHQLCDWLDSPSQMLCEINPSPEETESVIHKAKQIAVMIEVANPERYKTFRQLVHRVVAAKKHIEIQLADRTINKAFLAPNITRAILSGTQPPHITLKVLKKFAVLPNDWEAQRILLKFTA
jgi:DNA invertase Pin-like site-specific DNA recombinase